MPYVNLPANLQQMFQTIADRLRKLENSQRFTAPNVPVLTSQPTVTGLIASDPQSPRVGDVWLNTVTNSLRYVDTFGLVTAMQPAGMITPFGGATSPNGWLLCDGTAVSRTTYAGLFATLGTNYGAGNGTTTFNLPNLRGEFLVGLDGTAEFATLGQSSGQKTHSHTLSDAGAAKAARANNRLVIDEVTTASWTADNEILGTGSTSSQARTAGLGLIGSTDATTGANGLPPYVVVNYIIKY